MKTKCSYTDLIRADGACSSVEEYQPKPFALPEPIRWFLAECIVWPVCLAVVGCVRLADAVKRWRAK